MALLEIDGLVAEFITERGRVRAVDGLDLAIDPGETVALVGESGCGKSATALSVLRLIPSPPGHLAAGSIRFDGEDLLRKTPSEMRDIRGNRIAMIFQEPMSSLNPTLSIGAQIAEPMIIHQQKSRAEARRKTIELLRLVQIANPERRVDQYPHELSGGMRQRAMIAMALACRPALLIADEPTTALDVTIQAQVLDLLRELRAVAKATILLVTHDFGVVAEIAERVVVMYAGRKVEEAPVTEIFDHPAHPYTRALMASAPRLGATIGMSEPERLTEIAGVVPSLSGPAVGCVFASRCAKVFDRCRSETPAFTFLTPNHVVACHLAGAA